MVKKKRKGVKARKIKKKSVKKVSKPKPKKNIQKKTKKKPLLKGFFNKKIPKKIPVKKDIKKPVEKKQIFSKFFKKKDAPKKPVPKKEVKSSDKKSLIKGFFKKKDLPKKPVKEIKPVKKPIKQLKPGSKEPKGKQKTFIAVIFLVFILGIVYALFRFNIIDKTLGIYLLIGIGIGAFILFILALITKKQFRKRVTDIKLKGGVEKQIKKEEKKEKLHPKHRFLYNLMFTIFAVIMVASLILENKGHISGFHLKIILASLLALVILLLSFKFSKKHQEKKGEKEKEEQKVINIIKKRITVKSSKYKTDLDKLYELIKEEGCVTIPEVAEGFGVTEARVEEWGKILESHGLISINYPALGEVELVCLKKSKNTK